jgi:hypothetical protein
MHGHGPEGETGFVEPRAPTDDALQAVRHEIVTRMTRLLARRGMVGERQRGTWRMADHDADSDDAGAFGPLRAAARSPRGAWHMQRRPPGPGSRHRFGHPACGRLLDASAISHIAPAMTTPLRTSVSPCELRLLQAVRAEPNRVAM